MDELRHPTVDVWAKLIRILRTRENVTLEDAAEAAGIHRTHLGLLERGERQPTLSVAIQISKALGFELSELLLKAELVEAGKVREEDVFRDAVARIERPHCLRNQDALFDYTGLTPTMLLHAIHGCYNMLDTIDTELIANGAPPIGGLVELANLSSMVGNMVGGAIAEASEGLYVRNRPHHYPDLLAQRAPARHLELKMALETNRPKGHLPKPGTYITFRYVLADRNGVYTRGKETRGNTVWIWEVKVGDIRQHDFDLSNTDGDSGKTAVVKTAVFNQMPLVYFDPDFCPYAGRGGTYPGYN